MANRIVTADIRSRQQFFKGEIDWSTSFFDISFTEVVLLLLLSLLLFLSNYRSKN